MFLVESYAQGKTFSLDTRLRLSGAGVTGEVVYAGVTSDGHPVVVPLPSVLRGVNADPIVCVGGVIESVDDRDGDSDARCLLALISNAQSFRLATRSVKPTRGDVLEANGRPLMFCGKYRGKLVFASPGPHGLQHLGSVNNAGRDWNIGIMPEADSESTGLLRGVVSSAMAEEVFRAVTSRAYPGARVRYRKAEGTYLRGDGRYGLHHLVAFPVTEESKTEVAGLDVDRITVVDGVKYALAFVSSFGEALSIYEFPEAEHTRLALRITESVPAFRRLL